MNATEEPVVEEMKSNFDLLQNEIKKELTEIGKNDYVNLDKLTMTSFDSTAFNETYAFLEKLKAFYASRYNKADRAKDQIIVKLTDTPEQRKAFETFRDKHRNEAIAEIVKNQNEQHRIIETNGHLVQKIFPIYKDPVPSHFLDYREQFYVPRKHFAGFTFDTLHFNLGVIWFMSIILIFTLYFDLLRKLIQAIEKLFSSRR